MERDREHMTRVERVQGWPHERDRYVAHCSCGWVSRVQAITEEEAENEATDHVVAVPH
jgi:hypothetical protein